MNPPAHDNLAALQSSANVCLAEGRLQEAIGYLRRIVELRPGWVQAHENLGEAHERHGDIQAAVDSFRCAATLAPDSVEIRRHLARLLYEVGSLQSACEEYQAALRLDANRYEAYRGLGIVLRARSEFEAATTAFQHALRLNPGCARTVAELGRVLLFQGDLLGAVDFYREAINRDPKLAVAYADLGWALYGLGKQEEAGDCFRRLLALQPDFDLARVNLAFIRLLQGDWPAGWGEYESRWKIAAKGARRLSRPQWDGRPLEGERILLWAEQGLGDTLQFVRYVPLVVARGGEVVLEVQPELRRLVSRACGAGQVIARGDPLPDFAWQCPLLSLPLAFQTELNSVPANVPYVFPDAALVEAWRQRLSERTRRIGLVWKGNPENGRDRLRSMTLEQLLPLLKTPRTTFYSLQVGSGREQPSQSPLNAPFIDLAPELKDFADTAAVVANLDLVICIDSSVAHLAGSMGKTVWIALNKGCEWRWLLDREDSPWYPSARLFRQTTAGKWDEVVHRMEIALRDSPLRED